MTRKTEAKPVLGPKALEMVMRDVLGGLEDFAIMKSYESGAGVMEVLSIESPESRQRRGNSPEPQLPRNGEKSHESGAGVVEIRSIDPPGSRQRRANPEPQLPRNGNRQEADDIVLLDEHRRRKVG